MSVALIYGDSPSGTTVRLPGMSVWVKALWDDTWTWIPYLYPIQCTEATASSVGSALFEFDYGVVKPADLLWNLIDPLVIGGGLILTCIHNKYGMWSLWFGIVDKETLSIHGTGAYPQGRQTFTAYDMSHFFDRIEMHGSWAAFAGGGWLSGAHIDRDIPFNERRGAWGLNWKGNRSNEYDYYGPVYYISSHGDFKEDPHGDCQLWSNLEILKHILFYWSPLPVVICGELGVLDDIIDQHKLGGMTLKEAIDALIDRHRGLSYRFIPFIEGSTITIYLYVFSLLANPISYYEYTIPANPDQCALMLDSNYWIEPQLTFDDLTAYDEIVVEGEEIGVCFTLSTANLSLVKGWTDDEEEAYKLGASGEEATAKDHDAERATDKFRRVYQYFRTLQWWEWVDYEGTKLVENLADDGSAKPVPKANYYLPGHTFERQLPLYTNDEDVDSEARTAFVIVLHEGKYYYVDRLSASLGVEGANVALADNELGIYVRPAGGAHRFALGSFDTEDEDTSDSRIDPEFNYGAMLATVFVKTDKKLRVKAFIPGVLWKNGGRIKTIKDPSAARWTVVDKTVLDVTDGALVLQDGTEYVRDDVDRLRRKAALAVAYYGQQRSIASLTISDITLEHPAGSLILAACSGGYILNIGTVVTSRTWDFASGRTTIQTGFQELDIGVVS